MYVVVLSHYDDELFMTCVTPNTLQALGSFREDHHLGTLEVPRGQQTLAWFLLLHIINIIGQQIVHRTCHWNSAGGTSVQKL
jgi:hypothetical protein